MRTVITTPARKELIEKLAAGLNGPVSLVFAGGGASEAGLCLDELAQSIKAMQMPLWILTTSIAVVHHLYVRGRPPRQGRAVVDSRNVMDYGCVLGADLRPE